MIAAINRFLDGLVRPEVPLLGRPRPAFQVCGFFGLVTAVGLLAWLTSALALTPWLSAIVALASATVFLVLAMAGKMLRGRTQLVFYRHALAIGAVAGGVVAIAGGPVLRYLDMGVVALTGFLAFGRTGCLMVGCCHGKPAGIGVRYRRDHAVFGFSPELVGVRLFPTQALEAATAFMLAAGGAIALTTDDPEPGVVAAGVATGYALVRFLLESARGDRFRPIVWGFSEAQWMSVALVAGVVALGLAGVLPQRGGQLAAAIAIGFAMFFIASWRYLSHAPRHRLLLPAHIHEVAQALDELPRRRQPGRIEIATTSQGIQLSMAHIDQPAPVEHITIAHRDGPLPEEVARIVVDLIRDLRPGRAREQIVPGRAGTFHVLFHL
jgi:Prolipoprotein diacylglyceryl transferase